MNKDEILEKYGKDTYEVNKDTFHMGVHHLLSREIASRFKNLSPVLDACAGAGFMTIALAKNVDKVIAFETDQIHLAQAQSNAKIDDVDNKIIFIKGDVIKGIHDIGNLGAVFLDPDWALPGDEKEKHVFELSSMQPSGETLLEVSFNKTKNVCLRLPKEFDLAKIKNLPRHETQEVYLNNRLKFYCIYFGDLIVKEGVSELRF